MIGRALIFLLLLGPMLPARAVDEAAGRTVFVIGTVTAERDKVVALSKDDPVFGQDIIVTAERSRAQLLMRDDAKISLRPATRFLVAEYFLRGDEREQPDGSVVVATEDSAVYELIKGGFRTITGAIGRDEPDAYEAHTPAATMGIRGTHYSAVWCAGDCRLPPGISSARWLGDGLYVGVSEGLVHIANDAGELLLRAGEYAYVRDRNTRPRRLREMPAPLIDSDPTYIEPLVKDDPKNGGPEYPEKPTYPCCLPVKELRSVAMAGGPIPGVSPTGYAASSQQGLRTFTGNDLTDFDAPPSDVTNDTDTIYAIGTAVIRDDGGNQMTGIGWGRWAADDTGSGMASITLPDGSTVTADLTAQSLHWVYGPGLLSQPVLPTTGTASFTLVAGNTDPTDTLGNSGVLGSASLIANFTMQTVASQLSLAINSAVWQASGTGTITENLFDGIYDSVLIDGRAGGSGDFSGFFGAPGANRFPGGAGLTYSLNDPTGVSVSGAVAFGEPTTR